MVFLQKLVSPLIKGQQALTFNYDAIGM
jgi:hypothetical protein